MAFSSLEEERGEKKRETLCKGRYKEWQEGKQIEGEKQERKRETVEEEGETQRVGEQMREKMSKREKESKRET